MTIGPEGSAPMGKPARLGSVKDCDPPGAAILQWTRPSPEAMSKTGRPGSAPPGGKLAARVMPSHAAFPEGVVRTGTLTKPVMLITWALSVVCTAAMTDIGAVAEGP